MITTVSCAKTRSSLFQKQVNSTEKRNEVVAMHHKLEMSLIKRICANLQNKQNISRASNHKLSANPLKMLHVPSVENHWYSSSKNVFTHKFCFPCTGQYVIIQASWKGELIDTRWVSLEIKIQNFHVNECWKLILPQVGQRKFYFLERVSSWFAARQGFVADNVIVEIAATKEKVSLDCGQTQVEGFAQSRSSCSAFHGFLELFMLINNFIQSAIFVKPQQWPTPSESIAIYCVRKLVSCITHLQSCATVDIWNKKKKITHCC